MPDSRSLRGQCDSNPKEKGYCKGGMGLNCIHTTWWRIQKKKDTPFPGESEVVTQCSKSMIRFQHDVCVHGCWFHNSLLCFAWFM